MIPAAPQGLYPGARRVTFGKDQPEFVPLPAVVFPDGVVMTEWELTAEELARVLNGGRLRLWIWTFGKALQPVALEAVE